MRTTRRSLIAALLALPAGVRAMQSGMPTPATTPALKPHVVVSGHHVDFTDLVVTHTLATFHTVSAPAIGAPIRITLGTDVLFTGRVVRWILRTRGPRPLYYEVSASS